MGGINRAVELAQALLHIGGLSGAAAHIAEGDQGGALVLAVVASVCVLLLTGAVALAEISKVKLRHYVRRHKRHDLRESGGKEDIVS